MKPGFLGVYYCIFKTYLLDTWNFYKTCITRAAITTNTEKEKFIKPLILCIFPIPIVLGLLYIYFLVFSYIL